ncbi:UNVERIFIED_ORG: His/Glu/Gln/Arg/opine family amino acid ABC transporter permease subunit [Pseudomonas putida]|jgi:His/Glu/Gln/Arg/opine family amino acid ABC transporter permease subunit|nr:His/Glu/Gln/Arg/opine family amino acid ABC transporter permease subunit [Pseudomonas putida]
MIDSSWIGYLPTLLAGASLTIVVTIISMLFGTVIGVIVALMKLSSSRVARAIASIYGTLIRGLPLLVQILLVYFAIPAITGLRVSGVAAGTVAMTLFTGAFMAEIIRSGIQSIDKGQYEACRSIGFSHWATMRLVICPQAFRVILPSIANQFSITLKDTSLLSVIGVVELTMAGQTIYALNFDTIRVLALVGIMYLIIYLVAEQFSGWVERRLAR